MDNIKGATISFSLNNYEPSIATVSDHSLSEIEKQHAVMYDSMLRIKDLIAEQIKQKNSEEIKILETALRTIAKPPIKGEITKGKLQWRGIRLVTRGNEYSGTIERWLDQRGKRISPIIRHTYTCKI